MELYVYSDESGVFDKKHNEIFVYGGMILLNKELCDITSRKYIHNDTPLKLAVSFLFNRLWCVGVHKK